MYIDNLIIQLINPYVNNFLLSYYKTVNKLRRSWINVDTAECSTARTNFIDLTLNKLSI